MAAVWRQSTLDDISGLMRVGNEIHPDLPESEQVLAERIRLYPQGCLTLQQQQQQQQQQDPRSSSHICGYAISHPIRQRQPPQLDSLLGNIALDADEYYIHDVAILPSFRGIGLARQAVEKLLHVAAAEGYSSTCLVSVYGTLGFWGRFGFAPDEEETSMRDKLKSYGQGGDDARFLCRLNSVSSAGKTACF